MCGGVTSGARVGSALRVALRRNPAQEAVRRGRVIEAFFIV